MLITYCLDNHKVTKQFPINQLINNILYDIFYNSKQILTEKSFIFLKQQQKIRITKQEESLEKERFYYLTIINKIRYTYSEISTL